MILALLVPADPSKPCGLTPISGLEDIAVLVGGRPELTRYDHDALMFVHGEGRILGQQLNARATRYIKTASAAAARNASLRNDEDPTYGLYGDVVITGNEPVGKHGAPERLVEWFETNADTDSMQPPRTGPFYCPRCDSHSPNLHPAVQHGGEGTICPDDFHGDFRPRAGESLRDFSRRAYGTGPRTQQPRTLPLPEVAPTPTLADDVEEVLRAHDLDGPDAQYQPEVLQFARAAERIARALKALLADEAEAAPERDRSGPGVVYRYCPDGGAHHSYWVPVTPPKPDGEGGS